MTILVACGLQREATIATRDGMVAIAGGGDNARLEAALEAEVAAGGVTAILSSGLAGALDPGLKAGDVVIGHVSTAPSSLRRQGSMSLSPSATAVETEIGPCLRRGDGGRLIDALARLLPHAHVGMIAGADTIIASAAEKAALYAQTGALAVDMESHVAARVAARHRLPFAILRTISDTADHALPPAALVGMRPDGGVALGAILRSLGRDPTQLPALIRTGRDAGAAFAALRRALGALEAHGIGRLDLGELGLDIG